MIMAYLIVPALRGKGDAMGTDFFQCEAGGCEVAWQLEGHAFIRWKRSFGSTAVQIVQQCRFERRVGRITFRTMAYPPEGGKSNKEDLLFYYTS